jgi:3-dehydroquinate synthetase
VAIGIAAETRLAELLGIAEAGLSEVIGESLSQIGLPTTIPAGLERRAIIQALGVDKKKAGGKVRFALPVRIGEVVRH